MTYLLDITMPGVPIMNTSARLHRSIQLMQKKIWFDEVRVAVHGKKPEAPLAHANVVILRCSGNVAPDYDNLVQGGKWLLDALVAFKVLKDDDPINFIGGRPDYRWEAAGGRKPFVRVVVEAMEAMEAEVDISWHTWASEVSKAVLAMGGSLGDDARRRWEASFDRPAIESKIIIEGVDTESMDS